MGHFAAIGRYSSVSYIHMHSYIIHASCIHMTSPIGGFIELLLTMNQINK